MLPKFFNELKFKFVTPIMFATKVSVQMDDSTHQKPTFIYSIGDPKFENRNIPCMGCDPSPAPPVASICDARSLCNLWKPGTRSPHVQPFLHT